MSRDDKILRCPFCQRRVEDSSFNSHIFQEHPEKQDKLHGSYIRWVDSLRLSAGGDWRLSTGSGEGRGLHNV